MNKQLRFRIREAGFEVDFNPPKDGDCFHHAAAHQLGISCETAKNQLFTFLESNRVDVSHDLLLSNMKYSESYTILIHYLCRSLSRVVKLWEKIVAEDMSSWVRKHTLRVTSPKGRREGRKSFLTYQLTYLFRMPRIWAKRII